MQEHNMKYFVFYNIFIKPNNINLYSSLYSKALFHEVTRRKHEAPRKNTF
jgi:hypothetical protein